MRSSEPFFKLSLWHNKEITSEMSNRMPENKDATFEFWKTVLGTFKWLHLMSKTMQNTFGWMSAHWSQSGLWRIQSLYNSLYLWIFNSSKNVFFFVFFLNNQFLYFVSVRLCSAFISSPAGRGRWALRPGRWWEQHWCIPLDPGGSSSSPSSADSPPSGTDETRRRIAHRWHLAPFTWARL